MTRFSFDNLKAPSVSYDRNSGTFGSCLKDESAFGKLAQSIEDREGYSREAADATAAKIGREKYGDVGMAERSASGRKKAYSATEERATDGKWSSGGGSTTSVKPKQSDSPPKGPTITAAGAKAARSSDAAHTASAKASDHEASERSHVNSLKLARSLATGIMPHRELAQNHAEIAGIHSRAANSSEAADRENHQAAANAHREAMNLHNAAIEAANNPHEHRAENKPVSAPLTKEHAKLLSQDAHEKTSEGNHSEQMEDSEHASTSAAGGRHGWASHFHQNVVDGLEKHGQSGPHMRALIAHHIAGMAHAQLRDSSGAKS